MENKDEKLSFEDKLKKLETLVKSLEVRDINLDDAIKNYTLGLELSKECYEELSRAEKLVTLKMTEEGLEPFNEE
jgi:exodeoxyribonuclease VII small subunit